MTEECFNIPVYIPLKKESLSEKELRWIDTFQWILNLGLKQITKHQFTLSLHFSDNYSNINRLLRDKNSAVQLLISKNIDEDLLLDDANEKSEVIQVVCDPQIEKTFNEKTTVINFFDETKKKRVDLVNQVQQLKNEIWLKFLDIAYEIRNTCDTSNSLINRRGKIYVAETSPDQNHNRETIVRELEHLGFEVLPKIGFPKDMAPFSDMVQRSMQQCFLSVHLLGNYYAPLLNNIDVASIELQNDIFHEVAAELAREDKAIKRFVWIPPDFKPKSEKQKLYVESFKRNIELLKNTEIIQTPIEIFKNIIRTKTVELLSKNQVATKLDQDEAEKQVYVITNDKEGDNYSKIKSKLKANSFGILESHDKQNKIDLIKEHYSNLINCDAVLIDYSLDNNQWLNSKLSDVIKSPGFGRKKDFKVKGVLINTPNEPTVLSQIRNLDVLTSKDSISKRIDFFIEKLK